MAWDAHDRPEKGVLQLRPGLDERPEDAGVGIRVPAEPLRGLLDRAAQEDGLAPVERMGERQRRLDPLEAVILERNRPEEGRSGGHRMNRRAEVVDEPRERQLAGAEAAADLLGRLANEHRAARSRELDRGREAVGAGADDDGVVSVHALIQACSASSREKNERPACAGLSCRTVVRG